MVLAWSFVRHGFNRVLISPPYYPIVPKLSTLEKHKLALLYIVLGNSRSCRQWSCLPNVLSCRFDVLGEYGDGAVPLKFKLILQKVVLRSLLLPAGAFLLLSAAGLSSSSEADEPLFTRSAQQLERLWSGVLGCAERDDPFTVRDRFHDSGGADDEAVPGEPSLDYSRCGRRALRNTSSRMLVDTVEGAVRSGGVALFDQNFHLDSSIGWTWGENVTGELDAVVPLPVSLLRSLPGWERAEEDGQALFVQPGLVFWPGLGKENRIDGNLGLVYRRHLAPEAVAGGSVFYDYDFERGSSRFGLGADLQSGALRAGLNYYHPLNEWREGRTDYEEQALRGGDLRLGLAWSRVRLDASMGVWRFEGEDDAKAKWRPSFGLDAGVRILPGVFLEAGYERHDEDDSLGSRWKTGLAFRFILPGLDSVPALHDAAAVPDLFEPVGREKRILYEERLGIPRANLTATHTSRAEGETAVVTLELSDALNEDVALHLIIDESSTATLGSDADFSFGYKVYELNADTGEQSAPDDATDCPEEMCEMAIPAGVTKAEVSVAIHDDSAINDREQAEYIEMQVRVPEHYAGIVRSGSTARITIQAHGNTIAFASSSATEFMENGGTAEVTVEINEPSPAPITLTVTTGGEAVLNTDYTISTTRLRIPANAARASLRLTGIDNERGEGSKSILLTLSGSVPEGWAFLNDPERHTVTLLDNDVAIGFTASNPTLVGEGDAGTVDLAVAPNQPLPAGAAVGWSVTSGAADISGSTSGSLNFSSGDGRNDPQMIALNVNDDGNAEDAEEVTVTLSAASLPEGWSLGRDTHTFTIEPSDGVVAFTLTDAITANEGDTFDIGITSTADGPSGGYPLAISFSPSASSDIVFPATVSLPAGRKSQSFSITIEEDGVGEQAETFTMSLGSGGSADDWMVSGTRTVTINPNDIVVSFASPTARAMEGGAKVDTLLSVVPPPTTDSKVPFTLGGDGATAANYTFELTNASGQGSAGSANSEFDYRANETGVNIGVLAMEDNENIVDETLIITIDESNLPPGWKVGAHGVLTVTLADNDVPTIGFAENEVTEVTEGALASVGQTPTSTAQIHIVASRALPRDVNINVAITGDAEHPGVGLQADYVLETGRNPPTAYANGVVTLRSGQNRGLLILTAERDDDGDASETATFTLSGTLPSGWRFGDTEHTITIIDADSIPSVGFAESTSRVEEPAGSGTATHTIPLAITRSIPRDFTLDVILDRASTANADSNAGVVDFVETRTIDLKRGDSGTANLDITINGDNESEVDETIIFTLDYMRQTRPQDWRYTRRRHTITIPANDNTVTFSNPSSSSIAEEGGTATVTATINRPIPEKETATVTITPGGDAIAGTDYDLSVSGGVLNGNT